MFLIANENLRYVASFAASLQVKLTIMIEDPRDIERKRTLGIEDPDEITRDDLADALVEVITVSLQCATWSFVESLSKVNISVLFVCEYHAAWLLASSSSFTTCQIFCVFQSLRYASVILLVFE